MIPRGLPIGRAAEYIGCSPSTFETMVKSGKMPSPRRIGVKRVWDSAELDDAFEQLPKDNDNQEKNDWDES